LGNLLAHNHAQGFMKKVGGGMVFDSHFPLIDKAALKNSAAQSSGQFLMFPECFVKFFSFYGQAIFRRQFFG
jgi:hypothetical protein